VTLVKTDVSEECIDPIIRVEKASELGTTLAVSNHGSTLRRKTVQALRAQMFEVYGSFTEQSKYPDVRECLLMGHGRLVNREILLKVVSQRIHSFIHSFIP
jgi:hypothetical protein